MDDWSDIGDGLEARKAGGHAEVRSGDPEAAERHDCDGRILVLTRDQVTAVAARPSDWRSVGGQYEARFSDGAYEVRGVVLPDLMRHGRDGLLCKMGNGPVERLMALMK
jgi:hypothetical protein